jgi:hypothetical protein
VRARRLDNAGKETFRACAVGGIGSAEGLEKRLFFRGYTVEYSEGDRDDEGEKARPTPEEHADPEKRDEKARV